MKKQFTLLFVLAYAASTQMFAQWQAQTLPANAGHGISYPRMTSTHALWCVNQQLYDEAAHPAQVYRKTQSATAIETQDLYPDITDTYLSLQPVNDTAAFMWNVDLDFNYTFRKTTDGGATWTDLPAPPVYPNVYYFWTEQFGMFFGDPDAEGPYIAHTYDGGLTWQRVPTSNIPAFAPDEYGQQGSYRVYGDMVVMLTTDFSTDGQDYLLVSNNRGYNWYKTAGFPNIHGWYAFTDASNGMVIPENDVITKPLITSDGGLTWKQAESETPGKTANTIFTIPGTNALMGTFVNADNAVFTAITNDLGATWQRKMTVGPAVYEDFGFGAGSFLWMRTVASSNRDAYVISGRRTLHKYAGTDPIVPETPDLELSMTSDQPYLTQYQSVNYLPQYKRDPNAIAPFAFQYAWAEGGQLDWWNGKWTVPSLDPGAAVKITYVLYVLDDQSITQSAQVMSCTQTDYDSHAGNSSGSEDDEVRFMLPPHPLRGVVDDRVEAITTETKVESWPNPAAQTLWVRSHQPLAEVRLTNLLGATVWEQTYRVAEDTQIAIPVADQPAGAYMLQVHDASGAVTMQRVMVQR
jgi:photosystem II stability/assembly factor-like uncharacterized protein